MEKPFWPPNYHFKGKRYAFPKHKHELSHKQRVSRGGDASLEEPKSFIQTSPSTARPNYTNTPHNAMQHLIKNPHPNSPSTTSKDTPKNIQPILHLHTSENKQSNKTMMEDLSILNANMRGLHRSMHGVQNVIRLHKPDI